MVAFGQPGERALPKPKKKKGVLIRSQTVRMIGYPPETKGYMVVDKKGNQWRTDQVKFSHRRQPTSNGRTIEDDRQALRALERDLRQIDDDLSIPQASGK